MSALSTVLLSVCLLGVVCSDSDLPEPDEGPSEILEFAEALSEELIFTADLYNMQRNIGRSVSMTCSISGPAPLNVFILHDMIETYKQNNRKRTVTTETIFDPSKPNEMSVVYVIDELKERQAGIYRCQGESGDGQIILSTSELSAIDPCSGIQCDPLEQCVNNKGTGACSCDFACDSPGEDDALCVEGVTYASVCHLSRVECRRGESAATDNIASGKCPDAVELTEASCTLSGEGHVRMFNGDFFSFKGSCPFKMAEDDRDGMVIFYARTESCGEGGGSNCLRSVTIYVDRVYGFSLERGWFINDNGKSRNVANGETLVLGDGLVQIQKVGKTLVGTITNKNIKFYYDGLNYFKISVPFDFVENHSDFGGFCGGVPVDYMPVAGRDVGAMGEVADLPALSAVCTAEIITESTCSEEDAAEISSAFANSAGLADCNTVIPIDSYAANAARDTCGCDNSVELNYCFCNVAYAYQEDCRQAGVDVEIVSDMCVKGYHKAAFKAENIYYRMRRRGRRVKH